MRSKPEVADETVPWYEAFRQLSFSRPAGMAGAMPIPISEVEAYCRLVGVAPMDRAAFLRLIRQVDLGFLELLEKRKGATLAQPKGAS